MTDNKKGVDKKAPKAKEEPEESKTEKFIRIANIRAKQVLKGLMKLETLGKSYAYEFTEKEVETLFDAIDTRLATTKQVYVTRLEGRKTDVLEDILQKETPVE